MAAKACNAKISGIRLGAEITLRALQGATLAYVARCTAKQLTVR